MVYRYESDEDPFLEYPDDASGPPVLDAAPQPPAGPSPSRFPTPALPRGNQMALPSADPAPAQRPRSTVYATAPIQPPARRGGGRVWQLVVGGAAVLVLLALCGLGTAALIDERNADSPTGPAEETAAAAPPTPAPARQNLDSRDADGLPLTAREVFAGQQLIPGDGRGPYPVLKRQSSGSCAVAATGEVAELLVRLGCSQVVRATLRSPGGEHLVTTGLFNLPERTSAEEARDRIRQLLDDRQGRFRGMVADDETEAISTAPARVGWQVRGHYLAYALVARVDGATVRSGDTTVREILFDLIELHLNQGVLERRAQRGTTTLPTGETTGSQDGQSTDD